MRSIAFFAGSLSLAACTAYQSPGPGDSVYTADVRTIVVAEHGGGFGPPPPTGPCDPGVGTYTLTVATHHLAWSACDIVDSQPPTTAPRTGERALTAGEWQALQPQLAQLVVYEGTQCGADKGLVSLIVTTSGGTTEYADGFYACQHQGQPMVDSDGLGTVEYAFRQLAK